MFDLTGCDAVMIGRAAIGDPWIFSRAKAYLASGHDPGRPLLSEQIDLYLSMVADAIAEKGEKRGVCEQRRLLGGILRGFPRAAEVRAAAMREQTLEGIERLLAALLSSLDSDGSEGAEGPEPAEAWA
jgi:tRNA-dihydrouridine synthase